MTRPRFSISPSRIARYFFSDCERQLRYGALHHEHHEAEGVPFAQEDSSPLVQAIQKQGHQTRANHGLS